MIAVTPFEGRKIRTVWDEARGTWYFAVVDVVAALTDSPNPTDYLKKMRKRDILLGGYIGTNCPQVAMPTANGKMRKTLAADTEQLLRIIQSIPSPKAEPFKLWLAMVGRERIDETIDPELTIDRAFFSLRLTISGIEVNNLRPFYGRAGLLYLWTNCGIKIHSPDLTARHACLLKIRRRQTLRTIRGHPFLCPRPGVFQGEMALSAGAGIFTLEQRQAFLPH
jgi:hypothetical protein